MSQQSPSPTAILAAAGFERIRLIREDDDRMAGLVEGFRP
jgi:hypothetical protein